MKALTLSEAIINGLIANIQGDVSSSLESLSMTLELEPGGNVLFCCGQFCGSIPKEVFGPPFMDHTYEGMYGSTLFEINQTNSTVAPRPRHDNTKMVPSAIFYNNKSMLPSEEKMLKMKKAVPTNILIEAPTARPSNKFSPNIGAIYRIFKSESNNPFLIQEAVSSMLLLPVILMGRETTVPEWNTRCNRVDDRDFLHTSSSYKGKRMVITAGSKPSYIISEALNLSRDMLFKDLVKGGLTMEEISDYNP